MAGIAPFDMLREGGNLLPDLEGQYQSKLLELGGQDPTLAFQAPGINPADINPESASAMDLVNAGMVDDGQGRLRDPMRDIALSREARYQMALEHDKDQREKIADSMLFKVGDTLADAGRVFLSPLFWLKGEDQSQYDPSERLKTGYRTQFNGLTALREANVEKFLNAREARLETANVYRANRLNYAQTKLSQDITLRGQDISAMSSDQKAINAFAQSSPERLALLNDANPVTQQASFDELTRQWMKSQGKGLELTSSQGQTLYLSDNQNNAVDKYSKAFVDQTQMLRDGFSNIQQLLNTPEEDGTGITDVAAIFSFIKGIDPGSVVRESEVQLFRQTIGFIEQLELGFENKKEGRVLSASQIKELKKYAQILGGMMSRKFNERKESARNQLSSLGLPIRELQDNYLGGYTAPDFDKTQTGGPTGIVEVKTGSVLDQAMTGDLSGGINQMLTILPGTK
jgi:hypothetical protein